MTESGTQCEGQESSRRLSRTRVRVDSSALQKLEEVRRQLSHLAQGISNALEPLREAFRQVDWDRLREAVATIERLTNPRAVEAFSSMDLVPSPSMEHEFVDHIVDRFEKGTDAEQLTKLVLSHYDENNCERVERIVCRLIEAPDFQGREEVLWQSLQAHRFHLDAITTYPLVAMIEGGLVSALVDFVEKPKQHLRLSSLSVYFNELPLKFVVAVGEHLGSIDGLTCLLNSMGATLYRRSHWGEEDHLDQAALNRHRLLHGRIKSGTRLNTIRCLLILDLLANVVPVLREFLQGQGAEESTDRSGN